ncbi:unnamed protein product, partial [Mesorhabditis belari]|uniref:Notch n=1 Tax=Mesorhabditis belari TaxID=2138241 RepID=A0AAF3EBC9_9BILA
MLGFFSILLIFPIIKSNFIPGNCAPGNCLNGGKCFAGKEPSSYWCRCKEPFSGSRCEKQPCVPYCQNGGLCSSNRNGTFSCQCPIGFTGASCEKMVPSICSSNPCSAHGTCRLVSSLQKFTCECENGWIGEDCSKRVVGCKCENGGSCEAVHRQKSIPKCRCPSGFTGLHCEIDVDECLDNPCDRGTCLNTYGSYECKCDDGWAGGFCAHRSRPDECSAMGTARCQNGGFCEKTITGKYRCTCPPMFSGEKCELDFDECNQFPCQNGGTCKNSYGGFECFCTADFMGKTCELPRDGCEHNKCASGSICVSDGNSYRCDCPTGRAGLYCDKVDQCAHHPCLNGDCITDRITGSFSCDCPLGFAGARCSEDVDECERDSPCLHGATCVNTQGGYACQCAPGYLGPRCEHFIEECQLNPCKNGGSCFANDTCFCQPGFGGRLCETVLSSACKDTCIGGKACLPDKNGTFSCQCEEGDEMCENELKFGDGCRTKPCEHGSICKSTTSSPGFQCFCLLGWEGDRCQNVTDYCARNPCQNDGHCVNEVHGAECVCEKGFSGARCEQLDSSCATGTCLNGGKCSNSTICECKNGFYGDRCELSRNSNDFVDSTECPQGHCQNGGLCTIVAKAPKCECARGFFGMNCQFWADVDKFNSTDLEEKERCRLHGCADLVNNGHCDAECNYFACDYDGGDCSAQDKPYAKCLAANYCARAFHDGLCDEVCNNEACLFDGFDCARFSHDQCPTACRALSQDGNCDSMCNIANCGFDGGDCEQRPAKLPGEVEVIVLVEPDAFVVLAKDMLVDVSALLRATVRIARDSTGPKAFKWSLDGGAADRIIFPNSESLSAVYEGTRAKRKALVSGVQVFLEIDVASCTDQCFSDPSSAASFVSAAVAKKQLSVPIYSALAVNERRKEKESGGWRALEICLFIFFCVLGVGVLSAQIIPHIKNRKRKRVCNAHVWTPPSEQALNEANAKASNPMRWHEFMPYGYQYGNSGYIRAEPRDEWYPTIKLPKLEQRTYDAPTELHWEAVNKELTSTNREIKQQNINALTVHSQTVLHLLVGNLDRADDEVIARVDDLAKNGADLDALDKDDMTPLFVSVLKNRVIVAEKLIKLGADPQIAARDGTTILHQTMKNSDLGMLAMLLRYETIRKMIEVVDDFNRTPLMVLARHHLLNDPMALMLVEAGAEVNSQGDKDRTDQTGETPLHFAAGANNTAMIRFLVEKNANKDAQDRMDRTPLFIAAEKNFVEAVKLLVESQASTEIADQKDRTPLDVAKENECLEVVSVLEKAAMRLPQPPPEKQPLPAPQRVVRARRGPTREPARKSRAAHPDTPPSSDRSDYSSPSPVEGTTRAGTRSAQREPTRSSTRTATLPSLSLSRTNQSMSPLPISSHLPDASNVLTPPQNSINASWNSTSIQLQKLPDASNVLTPPQNNGTKWNPSPPYDFHGVSIEYGGALYGGSDPFGPPCSFAKNDHRPPQAYAWQTNV